MTAANSISSPAAAKAPVPEVQPSQEPLRLDAGMEALSSMGIQCRLTVGAADDPLEREADAVADTVMRMPQSPFSPGTRDGDEAIQRKCAACEEEEAVRRKVEAPFSPWRGAGGEAIQLKCAACEEEEPVQRKLAVGAVDDPLEAEADRMADTVMRMPDTPLSPWRGAGGEAASITPFIQAKGSDGGGVTSDAVTSGINATRGGGSSMDRPTQSFMENRFGADFSNVKIHTGSYAADLSTQLNAQAFTVGSDIYFNSGKYNPAADSGKHLLAHELTHTIQQSGGVSKKMVQRKLDEPKRASDIDYDKAIPANLAAWEKRDRFYNIFLNVPYDKGIGIFPGSTPIAYANHIFIIQQQLKNLWKDKYLGGLNGIADDRLITDLGTIAAHYKSKEKKESAAYGIEPAILERFIHIGSNVTSNRPFTSALGNYEVFNLINTNYVFGAAVGDKGDHITYLKTVLFDMNYIKRDDISSSYDQKTADTIKQFQLDTGLKADGIAGPSTLQLLDNFLSNRTSAFITPGSEFMAWGTLSEQIIVYTDGDGDQKKELKLQFGKKGSNVTLVVHHLDTKERRGPLSFTFPGLDTTDSMWIYEYQRSNGIEPTIIRLSPAKKAKSEDGNTPPEYLITIKAPKADAPGLYHFNEQTAQFNAAGFKPDAGFAASPVQETVTNPAFSLDVGPYSDTIKLFFKSTEGNAALAPDAATGRVYNADLYLIGTGINGIVFGGAPMKVKLKSTSLTITTVRHNTDVISFDLDGDGVEDITLNYRITQAQKEQRPDFNRYIELFFNGAALDKEGYYRFEKIAGHYVYKETKSEDLFKQLVSATGNERLLEQQLPATRQGDLALLSNLQSQFYLQALEKELIQGDTYLAWKKLEISLQYLKLFVAGKTTLTDDDKTKIEQTAQFADDYIIKIRRDTKGKEKTGAYAMAAGPGVGSSTSYTENPYTGDSSSSTSSGFYYSTTKTEVLLAQEIRGQKWDKAAKSWDKLADGFNLWVSDSIKASKPDDEAAAVLAAQTRGAHLFAKELQGMIDNGNAIHLTRVKAVYYSYEKYMKEEGVPSIELPLYYYYNTASRKWWIVDLIQPAHPYWNHVELGEDEVPGDKPPKALFETLNSKHHLPKGILLYATPDNTVTGQVEMTEPWEWKDILAWFAAAVGVAALVGSIIFSGGAATPMSIMILQAMFAASAIAGGVAAGMDLYDHYKNEDLTPTTALLDIGNIAASIVGLSALSSGRIIVLASQASVKSTPWVGNWAKLALAADKVYVPLVGLNIGINGFNIALLTADTIAKLEEIEKSGGDQASKDRAKILLLAQLAFAGGLTILSLKGDMASLSRGSNIVIYPGKNGIPVAASAAEGINAMPIEELNLRAQDEFDQVLAIREKMFGKAASTEVAKLKTDKAFMKTYGDLNKEIYDILNNPTLDVATKKKLLAAKIDAFDQLIAAHKVLDKTVFNTEQVRQMVTALEEGNFGMRMTLHNGTVKMQGVELGRFPELIERVKVTNAGLTSSGSDKEIVIILMPAVNNDGIQEILLLARKRWVIPSGAKEGTSIGDIGRADQSHKQYIIDVGGGTNSFAVDMIPASEIKGSTILNTEYAPTFMEPSMTRGNLTWKNAASKTDANTVVVIGDPLVNMHEMTGSNSVRQVFINNVNAHYNEQQYKHLAEQLVKSMDKGGRVTVQWTDATEFDSRLNKEVSRGHITGIELDKVLQEAATSTGRTVTPVKDLAPFEYNYGITPSKDVSITPDKPLTADQRKGVTDPVPKFRWDFIFD